MERDKAMDERSILVLDLVRELDVVYGLERSFKVLDKTMLGNRFLVSMSRDSIGDKSNDRLLDLCGRIQMPQDFLARFRENLPYAKQVHFGFEENERHSFFHAALEYSPNWETEILNKPGRSEAVLLYSAFKWDPSNDTNRAAIKHTWYPSLSVENILERLSNILPPDRCGNPLQIAGGIVRLASGRIPPHDILYLEVTEEDSPWMSFDINLFRADFRVEELHPLLSDMCRSYSIPPDEFRTLYERIQNQRFAHLSGGIEREGRDFLTVYYGGEGIHTDKSGSGLARSESPISPLPARGTAPEKPPVAGVRKPDEKAGLLFQLVKSLRVEAGFERSFKIANGVLLHNRFLLGVTKEALGQQVEERLTETCRMMGMPKTLLDIFKRYLPRGNYVHFGFEQNEKTTVYKVYLEFYETIKEEIRKSGRRPDAALMHLGLKWDVANPDRISLTRYTWRPWLSSHEILQRVSQILEPERGAAARDAAEQLVSLALARIPDRDILYLEVTEEGNPRLSFDINVYRANLQLAEIYPLMSMLCRRHSIPFDTFHSLYEGIKTKRFGHLAAGVDREGKGFFTVYYGVQGTFGDSSRDALGHDEGSAVPAKYGLPARRSRLVRVEETDDKASRLYGLVKNLGVQAAFERSWKLQERSLLADRFLFGFRRPPSAKGLDDAIMNVCGQIDMPEDHLEMFRAELDEANIVLFGFEKSEKRRIYKAYLEFSDRLRQAVKQYPLPESVVIHTGFKWDVSDNSQKIVAQYKAFHVLRAGDIAARLLREFYANERSTPYRIVDDMLDLAGSRTQPGELLYFEVSEENNVRRSFDINMYLADLQMAELYPLLVGMARHYSIEPEPFEELYEAVKNYRFGHISGGADREGKDFLTVYFSERRGSKQMAHRGRGSRF